MQSVNDEPDYKLSFSDFIEVYMSDKPVVSVRVNVPVVNEGEFIELYSYQILAEDKITGGIIIIGHIDYTESGLNDYMAFLENMTRAFANKENK
jgi:hypothetical protein